MRTFAVFFALMALVLAGYFGFMAVSHLPVIIAIVMTIITIGGIRAVLLFCGSFWRGVPVDEPYPLERFGDLRVWW